MFAEMVCSSEGDYPKDPNHTHFKTMTNLDLQSRDQVLAMAMDPKANTLVFTDEDFDAELTLEETQKISGAGWFIPLAFLAAKVVIMSAKAIAIHAAKQRAKRDRALRDKGREGARNIR